MSHQCCYFHPRHNPSRVYSLLSFDSSRVGHSAVRGASSHRVYCVRSARGRATYMVRNSARAPFKMETTFYDEHSYPPLGNNVSHLKRTLTLDLNNGRSQGLKRPKFGGAMSGAPVLSSPDINMLKLATPELEKFIIAQNSIATPTPTTQILFPPEPTEEQEMYARGFVDALNELHHSDSSQGALQPVELMGNSALPGNTTYTNLDHLPMSQHYLGNSFGDPSVMIKDEPQTVPSIGSSPPLSPIDMECQEKIKLERKRQRNRVAASKCRRRKLERISKLEDKVKLLKGENTELSTVVMKLKEHVCLLKEQVMEHVQSGCHIMPNNNAFWSSDEEEATPAVIVYRVDQDSGTPPWIECAQLCE